MSEAGALIVGVLVTALVSIQVLAFLQKQRDDRDLPRVAEKLGLASFPDGEARLYIELGGSSLIAGSEEQQISSALRGYHGDFDTSMFGLSVFFGEGRSQKVCVYTCVTFRRPDLSWHFHLGAPSDPLPPQNPGPEIDFAGFPLTSPTTLTDHQKKLRSALSFLNEHAAGWSVEGLGDVVLFYRTTRYPVAKYERLFLEAQALLKVLLDEPGAREASLEILRTATQPGPIGVIGPLAANIRLR